MAINKRIKVNGVEINTISVANAIGYTRHASTELHTLDMPTTVQKALDSLPNTYLLLTGGAAADIANGDRLLFHDSSDGNKIKKTNITFDGATTNKFLSQKGTWETASGGGGTLSGSTDTSNDLLVTGVQTMLTSVSSIKTDGITKITNGTLTTNKFISTDGEIKMTNRCKMYWDNSNQCITFEFL